MSTTPDDTGNPNENYLRNRLAIEERRLRKAMRDYGPGSQQVMLALDEVIRVETRLEEARQ